MLDSSLKLPKPQIKRKVNYFMIISDNLKNEQIPIIS